MEPILDPEFDELEKELMQAGRDVRMSPALQAKTLAALGIGAAGVTAAATAKAGTLGWLTSKGGAVWGATLLGGAAVAGVVAVSGAYRQSPPAQPSPAAAVQQTTSPAAERAPAEQVPGERAVELEILDVEEPSAPQSKKAPADLAPVETAPVRKKHPTSSKSSKSPSSGSDLGAELARLNQVESALRAGNPGLALTRLAEYRKEFPRRQLGLEAEVLTIQALHENGSRAQARSRAESFVRRYPTSPLGVRAKQYLE